MKSPIWRAYVLLLRALFADGMLVALLLAPALLGSALRWGLPALIAALPFLAVLDEYKYLWDALLMLTTPMFALFSSAMVSLEERDNGLCQALTVTPLRWKGYLISRFVLPLILSTLYGALISIAFSSQTRAVWHTLALAPLASLTSLTAIGLIPSLARDKIAGMSMSKLCGLIMMTVFIPAFLPRWLHPALCWLPTYWFYRFLVYPDWLMAFIACAVSAAWLWPLVRRFRHKGMLQ